MAEEDGDWRSPGDWHPEKPLWESDAGTPGDAGHRTSGTFGGLPRAGGPSQDSGGAPSRPGDSDGATDAVTEPKLPPPIGDSTQRDLGHDPSSYGSGYGGYGTGYGQPPSQPSYRYGGPPIHVTNYLPWAIVVTLFCCTVGGIVSIVYSVQANAAAKNGDAIAIDKAARAKNWLVASVVLGLLTNGLYIWYMVSKASTRYRF